MNIVSPVAGIVAFKPVAIPTAPTAKVLQVPTPDQPIFDFPGLETGDKFDIAKGSKIGAFAVSGTAELISKSPNEISFNVQASTFGMRADINVTMRRMGVERVETSIIGSGVPNVTRLGIVKNTRENFLEVIDEYRPDDVPTVVTHDGYGRVTATLPVPNLGSANLVFIKQHPIN